MTYLEFLAIKAQVARELKLTPRQWLALCTPAYLGSDGSINAPSDTSGRAPVVEENSSSVVTYAQGTMNAARVFGNLFGARVLTSDGTASKHEHRLFQTQLTATAGGEIVAANVGPPALAGYQPCMLVQYMFSDQTDASIIFTVATSGGTLDIGPATWTVATTANAINPDYTPGGIAFRGDTDNTTIQFAAAAGQCGASQNVYIAGTYWYET